MNARDFTDFYRAVHRWEPFPWQVRLAELALQGRWPEQLALPTSAGKTSTLDIAVFALANQAGAPALERTAPLRIYYVIDRRLVVDEVTEHALAIADALADAASGKRSEPILQAVAERLRRFAADAEQRPLRVVAMRGGMYRNDTWTERPNQPLICVSTVDQVGSRLLFRGYGLTDYRRPIHAGLIGCDSLFLADEAHLSVPFCETLTAVARYQGWAEQPITPPLRVVRLSATLPDADEAFRLEPADWNHEVLAPRLRAAKTAELVQTADFEAEMATQAERLAEAPGVRVIGVISNRVGPARRIYEQLVSRHPDQAVLLTGRNRPYMRDQILKEYALYLKVDRDRPDPPGGKLYVVATQTVEVGANLDFDALVTEAAPLSSLRQRFGRLDRLGRRGRSEAVIVRRKREKKADPVYGEDLDRTWEWLLARGQMAQEGRGRTIVVDFGVNAMAPIIDESVRVLETPPVAPVLLPAHLDLWAQTSPVPHPDPDVAPYLHGPDSEPAVDVQVVWRADLDRERLSWPEIVKLAPPLVREALSVPIWAVRRWLRQEEQAGEVSDLGAGLARAAGRDSGSGRPVLVWRSHESIAISYPDEIRPGDTIVVPFEYGGADRLGWHPDSAGPVSDCGDECALELATLERGRRRVVRLRLHANMLAGRPDLPEFADAWKKVKTALAEAEEGKEPDLDGAVDGLLGVLLAASGIPWDHLLVRSSRRQMQIYPDQSGLVVTAPLPAGWTFRSPWAQVEAALPGTDEEELPADTVPVPISQHQDGVAEWARRFAAACGIAPALAEAIGLAGEGHDLGKGDPRFQLLLHGGNPIAAALAEEPLAKSGTRVPPSVWSRVRAISGYPKGSRHEFLSAALLLSDPAVLEICLDPNLAIYLVGTHHGRGRPFVPVMEDHAPEEIAAAFRGNALRASSDHGLWRLDSGWVERYWRLVRRYGHWGLAYLEAILRLADGNQSRLEQEKGEPS